MAPLNQKIHIVGISGSLRSKSYNRLLLQAFDQQLPENVKFTIADISELPFFNEDKELPFPQSVLKLKVLIDAADALVISSPEYNLSYTAVLKNALEWLSRRSLQAKLAGKPVALMGAAAISLGVSQSHLRDVMFALNMKVLNRPIIQIANPKGKFDEQGNLTDSLVKEKLVELKDELLRNII
jgi:chromate reductase